MALRAELRGDARFDELRQEMARESRLRNEKRRKGRKRDDGLPCNPDARAWQTEFDSLLDKDTHEITIGYLRVSSTHQTEGYGADVQKKHIVTWVLAKQLNEGISDRGIDMWVWDVDSGQEESRVGFEFIRQAVQSDRVKQVVAYRYDRLARNQFYSELIHREFRQHGTTLVSATEDIPKGPLGELMRQIIQALGQYEAALIAERLTRGKKEAVRQKGSYYGGMAPFGYLAQVVAANGKGLLKICKPEAEIVKLMFDLFQKRYTPYAIADYLNEQGVPTRDLKGKWNQSTINKILKREAAYRAEALFGNLDTDEKPAQDPILPFRQNVRDRTYMWTTLKAVRGWRVPPEGLAGEPVMCKPRANSRHSLTPIKAQTLSHLYRLLDEGISQERVAKQLNDMGLTTLKNAVWSRSAMRQYLDSRAAFEVAIKTVQGGQDTPISAKGSAHAESVAIEQKAIKRIKELQKRGLGVRSITNRINAEGYKTLAGNQWYVSGVDRVLKGLPKASDRYKDDSAKLKR